MAQEVGGEDRDSGAWGGTAMFLRSSGSMRQSRDGELGLRGRSWSMWGAGQCECVP